MFRTKTEAPFFDNSAFPLGFTLLELMVCMAIIGIMLGLGLNFFNSRASAAQETARRLTAILSRAKANAMLTRQKTVLAFDGNRVFRINADSGSVLVATLPADLRIAIDGRSLAGGKEKFVFSPLGYTVEKVIHVGDSVDIFSIYVPSVGSAFSLQGMRDLDEFRDELRKEDP